MISFLTDKRFVKFQKAKSEAKHYHQDDRYGDYDYYDYHLVGVATLVYEHYKDFPIAILDDLLTVAILHDIHEDHGYPIDLIISKYGYDVGMAVKAISYNKAEETRDAYYIRCAANPIASAIKQKDAHFNRLQSLIENNFRRAKYYQKAEDFMKPLI